MYDNYSNFIERAEIRIFERQESSQAAPLQVIPVDDAGLAEWQPTAESLAGPERELEYVLRTYRQRRVCFAGVCSAAGPRTLVSSRVVERDVVIDSRVAWEEGPEYPSGDQYDLETVLIHELGHFAGNRRHATRCDQSSPMIDTIFNGEWWRTPGDAFVVCPTPQGTGQVSAAGLRPARRAGRLVTRQIVVGELVRAE